MSDNIEPRSVHSVVGPMAVGETRSILAELIRTDEGTYALRITLDKTFGERFDIPQSRMSSVIYHNGFEKSGGPRTVIAIHLKER